MKQVAVFNQRANIRNKHFFQRSSAYPEFKSSHKIESCPCFITNAIAMFCPRTDIGENETQVFMVCGFIYHCILHEEGRVTNSVWFT